jgi:hypothetical protein
MVLALLERRTNLTGVTRACVCEPDFDRTRCTRLRDYCGSESGRVRCIRDTRQEPCPECDVLPVAQQ